MIVLRAEGMRGAGMTIGGRRERELEAEKKEERQEEGPGRNRYLRLLSFL